MLEIFEEKDEIFDHIFSYLTVKKIPINWKQCFKFHDDTICLKQDYNGPCGLLSVIQSKIIKKLFQEEFDNPNEILIEVILDIEYLIKKCYLFVINYSIEDRCLTWIGTNDRNEAKKFLIEQNWIQNNEALILFCLSIIILFGPVLMNSSSFKETIITNNGYTSLSFVLTLLTGNITDGYHDNDKFIGGLLFKGINKKNDIVMI